MSAFRIAFPSYALRLIISESMGHTAPIAKTDKLPTTNPSAPVSGPTNTAHS